MTVNQYTDTDDVRIKGVSSQSDQNGKLITYTDDGSKTRLDVTGTFSVGAQSTRVWQFIDNLRDTTHADSANKDDMTVNGSVSSKVFKFKPGFDEWTANTGVWQLDKINIIIGASGDPDYNEFATQTALTNGLLFEYQQGGVSYSVRNIKNNMDITQMFHVNNVIGDSGSKWLTGAGGRFFIGMLSFDPRIVLAESAADYFRVTVRDNLDALVFLRVGFQAWKVI